jgi:hypothetical protein
MDENIFTWMNLTSSKIMDEFFFKKKCWLLWIGAELRPMLGNLKRKEE